MNVKENKNNIFIILFTVCSALFAVPSIIYIFQNKQFINFLGYGRICLKDL